MAILDQIDGVVFSAFQQTFLSQQAEKAKTAIMPSPDSLYNNGPLSLTKGGPFSIGGLPSALRPADAFATAHWLRNIGKELFGSINWKDGVQQALVSTGKSKGFQFVSSQILLASLNPKDPELGGGTIPGGILNASWNPASLLSTVVPGARTLNQTSVTLGPALEQKFDPTTSRIDKYIKIVKLESQTEQNPDDVLAPGKPINFPTFGNQQFTGFNRIRKIASVGGVVRPKDTPETVHARFVEAADGDEDGVTIGASNLPDDQVYLPLVFQDLRDKVETFLYFRAFIKPDSVTETFTPTWNSQNYYGRVDAVPIYMNTSRIINFSFDVAAFQPADLPIIYRKIHKLQSMVYPLFDNQGFLSAGPIVRFRMGDLFSTTNRGKRGLPGYITSLDISYDQIWNIEKDFKVPRKATISVSYTVLHENNPGIYPTSENGKEFPTFGIGTKDGDNFKGSEIGIRGMLENIIRTREAKAKPASNGSDVASSNTG